MAVSPCSSAQHRRSASTQRGGYNTYETGFRVGAWFDQSVSVTSNPCARIPAAISQGETLAEAKANLLDALKSVLERQRELVEKELSPVADTLTARVMS